MTTEKSTGRDSDKIMLRVPDGMRGRIAAAAKLNNRTMNAEIVARLQQSFENNSSSGNLITISMDDFDAVIRAAVDRGAVDRAK